MNQTYAYYYVLLLIMCLPIVEADVISIERDTHSNDIFNTIASMEDNTTIIFDEGNYTLPNIIINDLNNISIIGSGKTELILDILSRSNTLEISYSTGIVIRGLKINCYSTIIVAQTPEISRNCMKITGSSDVTIIDNDFILSTPVTIVNSERINMSRNDFQSDYYSSISCNDCINVNISLSSFNNVELQMMQFANSSITNNQFLKKGKS